MAEKRTIGFWIIMIVGTLLLVMLILGQTMSFINYDFTVSIGLQEPKETVTEVGVAMNKGFAVGDTIIYAPLLVLGLAGLWLRKKWGLFTMAGTLAITAYWPVVSIFALLFARGTPGFNFSNFTSYGITLTLITIYGLWGIWYVCMYGKVLADEE